MEEFEQIKEWMNRLDQALKEGEKEKVRVLMVNIIVNLEKICHKPEWDLHYVLGEARERCKKEIDKLY